jgi:hypothetical protein
LINLEHQYAQSKSYCDKTKRALPSLPAYVHIVCTCWLASHWFSTKTGKCILWRWGKKGTLSCWRMVVSAVTK